MQSMMKTKHDNDIIDRIGVIYVENKAKLSWSIEQGAVVTKKR